MAGERWSGRFAFAITLLVALHPTPEVLAAQGSPAARWELGAFGGLLDDRPEFEPRGEFQLAGQGVFGARAAYIFTSGFFLEGELLYTSLEFGALQPASRPPASLRALFLGAGVGYSFPVSAGLQLFARTGGGGVRWDAGATREYDFAYDVGGGFRAFLAHGLAFRTDVRLHFLPSALATTRRALRPDLSSAGELLWMVGVNAGFSIFLGNRNSHEGAP